MTLNTIDNGKKFDWGKTSEYYAKYRDIYPTEFFEKIAGCGVGTKGQNVLDLATGTGVLPRGMTKYGAHFVGTDISENQINKAKLLSRGMDIEYMVSPAEKLEFADNTFDTVTACQCFMYFDTNALIPLIKRILRPDGLFAIMFMSWLPYESKIARQSEKLILKYNPAWNGADFKRHDIEIPEWSKGDFSAVHKIAFEIDVPFDRISWNGRIMACRGVSASLTKAQTEKFGKEHMKLLEQTSPESFIIPHFATILVLQLKGKR